MRSLISSNPEGIDNKTIAKVLLMTEEEVEKTYQSALLKLRKVLAKEI
jgi:DNA-directed RNA polymerase specialized sigma24 family protein